MFNKRKKEMAKIEKNMAWMVQEGLNESMAKAIKGLQADVEHLMQVNGISQEPIEDMKGKK